MTKAETDAFALFLRRAFEEEEAHCGELRLSDDEIECLRELYPQAIIEALPCAEYPDGKAWVQVTIAAE